jgi:hypothetical protein
LPFTFNWRKEAEKFNVVHKYHINLNNLDNDLFFVIGSIDFEIWSRAVEEQKKEFLKSANLLIEIIRNSLSLKPQLISLSLDDISIVKYNKTTLEKIEFAKRVKEVSEDELRQLY